MLPIKADAKRNLMPNDGGRSLIAWAARSNGMCPATTLNVAWWTPESGRVVGIAGDTREMVLWRDDESCHGRSVGRLHRSAGESGYLVR